LCILFYRVYYLSPRRSVTYTLITRWLFISTTAEMMEPGNNRNRCLHIYCIAVYTHVHDNIIVYQLYIIILFIILKCVNSGWPFILFIVVVRSLKREPRARTTIILCSETIILYVLSQQSMMSEELNYHLYASLLIL